MLAAPSFEQVFEGFSNYGLALAAADLFDDIELFKVLVDEKLAHLTFQDINVLTIISVVPTSLLLRRWFVQTHSDEPRRRS